MMRQTERFAVIMAGGSGRRLWPLSRINKPKQFMDLTGDGALIVNTIKRISPIFDMDHIIVIGMLSQRNILLDCTKALVRPENILFEPGAKNTAACIAFAMEHIAVKAADALVCILPADHYVAQPVRFCAVLEHGLDTAAKKDSIVTLGIEPTYAATSYGYIQAGEQVDLLNEVRMVKSFIEKPNRQKAEEMLDCGGYYWNGGIFISRQKVLTANIKEFLSDLYSHIKRAYEAKIMGNAADMEREYNMVESISIDFGVMEKSREMLVIPADFGWNDIGGYAAIYDIADKDENQNAVIKGNLLAHNANNLLIHSNKKVVAVSGVSNLVIIDTQDVLYICNADEAENTKMISEQLAELGYGELE